MDTVGGQFGPAVMNFGLSESEKAIASQINNMARVPTELSPTNHTPSDAMHVYGPSELGLIEGPIVAQPPRSMQPNELIPLPVGAPATSGSGLVGISPNLDLVPEAPSAPLPTQPLPYPPLPPNMAGIPQVPVTR